MVFHVLIVSSAVHIAPHRFSGPIKQPFEADQLQAVLTVGKGAKSLFSRPSKENVKKVCLRRVYVRHCALLTKSKNRWKITEINKFNSGLTYYKLWICRILTIQYTTWAQFKVARHYHDVGSQVRAVISVRTWWRSSTGTVPWTASEPTRHRTWGPIAPRSEITILCINETIN